MDKPPWKKYTVEVKAILIIYSLGFLVGTCTHAAGLMKYGFLAYEVPLAINLYWDLLTIADPLTSLLVWIRIKVGLVLAITIMATDIIINSYAYVQGVFGESEPGMIPLSLFVQSMFGLFVFVTAPVLIEKSRITGSKPTIK